MTLTNEKIKVTEYMMVDEGFTKYSNAMQYYAVLENPLNKNSPKKWFRLSELKIEDYDKIEEYFLNKK